MLAALIALLASLSGRIYASALPEIKLTTSQTGIYRVTDAELASALRISASAVDSLIASGGFTMLNQGQLVSWLPGNGNTEILFHAQALQNVYTEYNVYFLQAGTNMPPIEVNGANPIPVAQNSEYFLATTNIEQDLFCEYSLGTNPDSNYWYEASVTGLGFNNYYQSTFFIPTLASVNVTAQVNVRVCGLTSTTQGLSLQLDTTDNSWNDIWLGASPTNFNMALSSSFLSAGTNAFYWVAGTDQSYWVLNGFQLQYPSLYLAGNGSLVCGANSNGVVTVGGFTNGNITVLDVTQPLTPLLVTNVNIQSVSGGYEVSFAPQGSNDVYSVCQAGSEQTPADIEAVYSTGLASPTNQAAFIIIAPTNFLAATQPLVDYRNAQGLKTILVSMEAVYNEFDYGLRKPVAISNFLAYAWQNWSVPPSYVLLMGKGTYDYRNLLGYGDNYIPPLMVPSLNGLVASDSQYGQVAGAPGPQIAVGRLPVTKTTQVAHMITKIMAYEAASPYRKAVLLADLSDPSAGDFQANMGAVTNILNGSYTQEAILPLNTATNTTTMRNELLADLDAGADLFVYYGHGASSQFGNAAYLTTADVPNLALTSRPPLMTAMTCLSGFFAQPDYDCISEAMTLSAQQGAIGTVSASGFSLDSDATALNESLMAGLVSGTPGRLGDFVQQAMSSYNQVAHFTPSAMYNLLGDPTLLYVPTVLTGSVNLDLNGNGVADAGGVSPVVIQIYVGGTNLVATVTNNADGSYGVTNLPPGSYTVMQTVPSGWLPTTPAIVNVALPAGGTTTVNFLDAQPVTIGESTWLDVNGNGLVDAGEPALPGVAVALYETNSTTEMLVEVTNAVTDATGYYEFAGLLPGVYQVGFTPPAGGYLPGAQLAGGSPRPNNSPSQATWLTDFFPMLSGDTNLSVNAGFVPNASPVSGVTLGAYVTQGQAWVTWQTYEDLGVSAFFVTRSTPGGTPQNITPDYIQATGPGLGATYTVADAGAKLPGVYIYTLYGVETNSTVEALASVNVQLAAPHTAVPALAISSLTISGGNAVLSWTGGLPPYVVEQTAALGAGAAWQAAGPPQTGTQSVLSVTNQAGFFRVIGSQ